MLWNDIDEMIIFLTRYELVRDKHVTKDTPPATFLDDRF